MFERPQLLASKSPTAYPSGGRNPEILVRVEQAQKLLDDLKLVSYGCSLSTHVYGIAGEEIQIIELSPSANVDQLTEWLRRWEP